METLAEANAFDAKGTRQPMYPITAKYDSLHRNSVNADIMLHPQTILTLFLRSSDLKASTACTYESRVTRGDAKLNKSADYAYASV